VVKASIAELTFFIATPALHRSGIIKSANVTRTRSDIDDIPQISDLHWRAELRSRLRALTELATAVRAPTFDRSAV